MDPDTEQTARRRPAGETFAPTRWTLVRRAGGGSDPERAALSELCAAYYQPVFAFLGRGGRTEDAARELAHAFFARLLAGGGFARADPQLGRFRTYLLGAVKHFVSDRRDLALREKRGGGARHTSLDAADEFAPALQVADPATWPDDSVFDRAWAVATMNRAVAVLEAEHAGPGAELFSLLLPWLTGGGSAPHVENAAQLGMSEGAVKVALHRMRRRLREVLKAETAQTLAEPADVEDELRHLCAALCKNS